MTAQELIASGLLEQLVLGQLPLTEARHVEGLAAADQEAKAYLENLRASLERAALEEAMPPAPSVRARVLTAVAADAAQKSSSDRPPILHPSSRVADYARWTEGPGMELPAEWDDPFFHMIAANEDGQTALVWLRGGAPEETHTDCIEKFLIMEGSCEIVFDGRIHKLGSGDFLSIPLHTPHTVKVTSEVPCKIILQRIAA